MWCKFCNIETNEETCPVCGKPTSEDIPIEIYWCDSCKVPVIKQTTDNHKEDCPCCGRKMKYLAKDIRPVFPEERLLMELLLKKEPNTYAKSSVWASTGSRYYIDGKAKNIPGKVYTETDERVGCWLCPNNNTRDVFLANVYMPERAKEWREFLIEFAKNIGKPDPEEYIDSGAWKARQGGNGLPAAQDVKIKFTNCTTEEHAKIYKLSRPFDDELVGMFVPFGKLAPELGRKLLNETIVVEPRTNVPIMSIQPFKENDFEYAVKIRTMNVADHEALQRKAGYQVRKFNACHKCLKCESVCKSGAISIMGDYYYINPDKCVHCGMCVNQKILRGGCMMDKYLRTKD